MSVEVEPTPGERYCPTCEKTFPGGERCPDDGTRLVRLSQGEDMLIGRELEGRYTIKERLGQGGMGTVYRGTQHSVGREVAIKVVTPSLVSDPIVIKRFLRESKLSSALSHPNAVSVLDFGQTEDGLFYLIMELVNGRTLDAVLDAERTLSPQRIVRIGVQICEALEGAHQLKIVHRDLKPQNVMLLTSGRDLVKVLDFGIAKSLTPRVGSSTMTNAGALLGTPAYMPPELVSGQDCDHRADLYSLGCLLYVTVSGDLPFSADTVHELIAMHATEPPKRLTNVPAGLASVIERLLAKDPADRYQSAADARDALDRCLEDGGEVLEIADPTIVSRPNTIVGWAGVASAPGRSSALVSAHPIGSDRIASLARSESPTAAARMKVNPAQMRTDEAAPAGVSPTLVIDAEKPIAKDLRGDTQIKLWMIVGALALAVCTALVVYFVAKPLARETAETATPDPNQGAATPARSQAAAPQPIATPPITGPAQPIASPPRGSSDNPITVPASVPEPQPSSSDKPITDAVNPTTDQPKLTKPNPTKGTGAKPSKPTRPNGAKPVKPTVAKPDDKQTTTPAVTINPGVM